MLSCDTLIQNARVLDGSGAAPEALEVALRDGSICAMGKSLACQARSTVDAQGLVLAPGFIDTHTHDDTSVIRDPQMLAKLSQGVTTVIVGNCGICAAPVTLKGAVPDPMNLLGSAGDFRYPTFAAYVAAIGDARPAVNVGALVGHTALRNNHMDRLDRAATFAEIDAMRAQLREALEHGALGLSSGLAYASARAASTDEVMALAEPLAAAGALYATHMRTETDAILDAMHESFAIGRARKGAGDHFASQVRGHCQLGPQRRSAGHTRRGARVAGVPAATATPMPLVRARSISARSMHG